MADYAEESSDAARAYGKAYPRRHQDRPRQPVLWTFDAVTVLALAINKAGKTDPQAIREALLAVRGHAGAEGTYNFDKNGDGLHATTSCATTRARSPSTGASTSIRAESGAADGERTQT